MVVEPTVIGVLLGPVLDAARADTFVFIVSSIADASACATIIAEVTKVAVVAC